MTHPLEARGWTKKVIYFKHLYGGVWWHDLSGVPRFHVDSFVARVIDGREDNLPKESVVGDGKADRDARAGDGLQG